MEDKNPTPEKLPAEVRANYLSNETSIFFNVAMFEQAQRIATMFAESTMVPEHFRNNVGNCMIALNYALRLQADPFMLMQCMYVVHGKPGIEGKLVEAIINQSGKYSEPLQYDWLDIEDNLVDRRKVLNHKDFGEFGCQAFSIDAKSGKRVDGPKITWKLVKAKGWYDRKGPDGTVQSNNWRVMPEMMFYYRAASWFKNKNCPELTLGMHTVEELHDTVELQKTPNGSFAIQSAADKLNMKDNTQESGEDIYKTQDTTSAEKSAKKAAVEETPEGEVQEEPTEKEVKKDPIRILYLGEDLKGLTPRKFKIFLKGHMVAIPGMDSKYQDEIKKEHARLFPGQDFPVLIASDKAPEDKPKASEKSELPIFLNCPRDYDEIPEKNDDGRVAATWCENEDNCNPGFRETCKAFQEYQKNIGQ